MVHIYFLMQKNSFLSYCCKYFNYFEKQIKIGFNTFIFELYILNFKL